LGRVGNIDTRAAATFGRGSEGSAADARDPVWASALLFNYPDGIYRVSFAGIALCSLTYRAADVDTGGGKIAGARGMAQEAHLSGSRETESHDELRVR
jgi:hypothetical protein